MSSGAEDDRRVRALEAYLVERRADGYRVETRSNTQAVICRRHRLYSVLRWIPRVSAERRLVVSIDQDGRVTTAAAEPVRW